jgi:copper oxidase (laccase) domain-containing protein
MYQLPRLKDQSGLIHAFSTVDEGNMSVFLQDKQIGLANRVAFLKPFDFDLEHTAGIKPLDGNLVTLVEDGFQNHIDAVSIHTDALITSMPNIVLAIYPADCPIAIIFDPTHHSLGFAHLSWKSTDAKLVKETIKRMTTEFGSNPQNMVVGLCPGIQKESYVFTDPIQKSLPDWAPYLTDLPDGETSIDLFSYNRDQLLSAGVLPDHIELSSIDTGADTNFFSHYRAARTGEPEGRSMCMAALQKL